MRAHTRERDERFERCAGGGIRTPTGPILSRLPLPIGLHQRVVHARRSRLSPRARFTPSCRRRLRSTSLRAALGWTASRRPLIYRRRSRSLPRGSVAIERAPFGVTRATLGAQAREWRRRPDSNRRITDLQSAPLTTWVRRRCQDEDREILERETGFEPATPTLARSCSTTELFPLAPATLAQHRNSSW